MKHITPYGGRSWHPELNREEPSPSEFFSGVRKFFRNLFSCPEGWQDEKGFHFGKEPLKKHIKPKKY